MARTNGRSPDDVRREIARERDELADAVDDLRAGIGEAASLKGKLPLLAAGAASAGFVLAGGVGATMRLIMRRGREGRERARVGRYAVVDRS